MSVKNDRRAEEMTNQELLEALYKTFDISPAPTLDVIRCPVCDKFTFCHIECDTFCPHCKAIVETIVKWRS